MSSESKIAWANSTAIMVMIACLALVMRGCFAPLSNEVRIELEKTEQLKLILQADSIPRPVIHIHQHQK